MEFPELGTHCAFPSCSQLDFLPFECDACHRVFCKEHKTYDQHKCTEAYTKDVRVPVCPLCNQPVPVIRGEDPNIKVDQHIQQDCQSDKAKSLYTNRCTFPGCRKKELVRVTCNSCHKTFCLKHRFETDHSCEGHPNRIGTRPNGTRSRPGPFRSSAPTARKSGKPQVTTLTQIGAELDRERRTRQQQAHQSSVSQPHPSLGSATAVSSAPTRTSVQGRHLSEEEALALAIAASMKEETQQPAPPPPPQSHVPAPTPPTGDGKSYDEDEALARAIAASLNDEQPKPKPKTHRRNTQERQRSKDNCSIA